MKVKYGAWYLDPKTWRVHESNKPLIDPREIEEKQMSESKKKSKNLVYIFSFSLHLKFYFSQKIS